MFRNHYITIAAWIIVYISLWLSRDNLVSSKFSKNISSSFLYLLQNCSIGHELL